jgi:two-component system sensor histidine kinase/response regulator
MKVKRRAVNMIPKILVVDDKEINLHIIRQLLGRNYDLTETMDGETALQLIHETAFDLVLLDIMMPGMNGMEVLREIRKRFAPDQLPVIIVSALSHEQDVVAGLEAQANDYLTKPLQRNIIRARVETQLHLKRLADEREQLVNELKKANTIRNQLLRIASHDLKSPLHNVSMVLNLVTESPNLTPELMRMVELGHRSTHNMMAIIEEFLDLNVLREDRINISLEPIHLSYVLSEVILNYNDLADQKGIGFEVEFPEFAVYADPQHLQHAIANLVSNAIKYSPLNSKICVHVEVDDMNENAIVHVVDQGEGIPQVEQCKLFQPFTTISTKPTNGEHSSGLGLWIAHEMITMQNGDIGMQDAPGGGCDFWVKIPLASLAMQVS